MAKQNPGGDAGQHHGRRAVTWLTWWVLLMSLWVAVDDSLESDELLVGAGVAAVAALVAELVCRQAEIRFQVRAAWLVQALRLPGEVVQQTVMVFGALAKSLFTHALPPRGGYREIPVAYGDDTPLGETRRVLLTAGRSLAPNEFVLGIDPDRNTMVVHRLMEKP